MATETERQRPKHEGLSPQPELAASADSQSATLPIPVPDQQEILSIYGKIKKRRATIVGPQGEAQFPDSVQLFLVQLLDALGQGKSVTILQSTATVGTVHASQTLGVSRRHFVGLLEAGQIPFHMVGTHRRVYASDLFLYKAQRDSSRKKTIRELAKAEAAEGLYDAIPSLEDNDHGQ